MKTYDFSEIDKMNAADADHSEHLHNQWINDMNTPLAEIKRRHENGSWVSGFYGFSPIDAVRMILPSRSQSFPTGKGRRAARRAWAINWGRYNVPSPF